MSERNASHYQMPSLEQDCSESSDALVQSLDEYYKASGNRPLVDDQIDLLEPALAVEYLEHLTMYLGGRGHEDFLATHAAFHFAIYIAGLLDWQVSGLNGALPMLDNVPDDANNSNDARDFIVDTAKTYLRSRPRLNSVFSEYSSQIDPTRSFHDGAEAIYALTLRQIEYTGQRYVQQSLDELSSENE